MQTFLIYLGFAILAVLALLLLLLLFAFLRTLAMKKKESVYPLQDGQKEREKKYAELLARMVRCETVSSERAVHAEKFERFHQLLHELFPHVFQSGPAIVESFDHNLLIRWPGQSHEKPVVLMAHQDVVEAKGTWIYPPFSGEIADGKVWGRGSADTKCSLMAIFQALDELMASGYTPPQDVYVCSSCTEEWSGGGGPRLAAILKERGIRPFLLCDEGGGIIRDPMPGITGCYAMIGVLEKGRADVRFTARGHGGHASAPPKHSPIARLASFINRVETHSPFRRTLTREVRAMFRSLAPYSGFGMRFVFANLWLFALPLKWILPKLSAQAGAMIQTTVAFTTMQGSDGYNVLPQEASVGANLRYAAHQGEKETLEILKRMAADEDLEMEVIRSNDASRPIALNGEAFRFFERTVERVFPGMAYSPYVIPMATDAYNFEGVCDTCLRFAPLVYGQEQLKGMHGLDENVEIVGLPGAVDFYKALIRGE